MTAKELIDVLAKLDPDTPIQVESEDCSITDYISVRSNGKDWVMVDVIFETDDGSH